MSQRKAQKRCEMSEANRSVAPAAVDATGAQIAIRFAGEPADFAGDSRDEFAFAISLALPSLGTGDPIRTPGKDVVPLQ
jgi:hypothetical protein